MNSFGNIYRLTSFGESHGPAVGGVIDGFPPGVKLSLAMLQESLDRRRPGGSRGVSQRRERDAVRILSGVMAVGADGNLGPLLEGSDEVVTLGTPIGFYVENTDCRGEDYAGMKDVFRPNHADYTLWRKYGIRDWRGGGRSSGRETVSRVVAGALAEQFLRSAGIEIKAELAEIGGCSDSSRFEEMLDQARREGDSLGGVVSCRIDGVPAGIGEPTFGKLQQMLASAMLSIGGVHGFEYGDGFSLSAMKGSLAADGMSAAGFLSNHCGGIQGGVSNGQPVLLRVGFKPTPSVGVALPTVDVDGNEIEWKTTGRHDPCIAVRGAAVVEAMAAMVVMDAMLMSLASAPGLAETFKRR